MDHSTGLSKEEQWRAAWAWVEANRYMVKAMAARYLKFMASDQEDIIQEAVIVAYQVLNTLARKNVPASRYGAYFRTMFRTRCIKLAAGGRVTTTFDLDKIPVISPDTDFYEVDKAIIEAALQIMTDRQRQVFRWILEQPEPINATAVARKFGIQNRSARKLINSGIKRIRRNKNIADQYRPVRTAVSDSPQTLAMDAG
ncbi:hypothetical protein GF1_16210 [Desulfolithobacter dissulfuricans]|uniref:RNA polymerase sigma-70 region 2 domain-containing protein n=1 Tax=Desulfolithobacter dissulfuricans TaxID=2795293 RepID=A0A915UA80_9BACT|nr:sigma-70 family RNA polymerase sigma factor [Desulfolithobacter dissulfuricans]BCO09245.1 hypothetical protein GF1_16210 [Desulfolithobacter dissulfuricans]